jgi:hypothetical protein
MRTKVRLTYTTADAAKAIGQTVDAFGIALAQVAELEAPFEKIDELAFCFGVAHPALPPPGRGRASYSRDRSIFFSEAYLEYENWVDNRWEVRVDAVGLGAQTALAAVHKTRLTAQERSTLSRIIEVATERLKACPPDRLLYLNPFQAYEDDLGRRSFFAFQPRANPPTTTDERVGVLEPSEAAKYIARQPSNLKTIPTIKLYKRCECQLKYWEAWTDGDNVVEHSGFCGDRGSVSDHPAAGQTQQRKIMRALAETARADGFRTIPSSRLIGLLVSKEISDTGTQDDLRRRHALEDFLNEVTGWLGLGHCDGGSTGSGSMEAFCLVVDYECAAAAIERALVDSKFSDFSVSRALR